MLTLRTSSPFELFDRIEQQLSQQLQQQAVKKQLDTLKAAAKIELVGDSAPAAPASAASAAK